MDSHYKIGFLRNNHPHTCSRHLPLAAPPMPSYPATFLVSLNMRICNQVFLWVKISGRRAGCKYPFQSHQASVFAIINHVKRIASISLEVQKHKLRKATENI